MSDILISNGKASITTKSGSVRQLFNLITKSNLEDKDDESLCEYEIMSREHFSNSAHFEMSKTRKKLAEKKDFQDNQRRPYFYCLQ